MPDGGARIRWLGHATAEIEIDGVRLLTDPLFRDRLSPMIPRRAPEAALFDAESRVDAVLISHAHQDHLDLASLRLLPAETRLIVPVGLGHWLERRGFGNVDELAIGHSVLIGPVEVRATHAAHGGTRLPFGPAASAVGYVVQGSTSIYFAGDTELFAGMVDIPRGLDTRLVAALLPVGGWGPTLRGGHMDPRGAAEALHLLRPVHAIPIHWGTYWPRGMGRIRSDRFHLPGSEFRAAAALAEPTVQVDVMRPGEACVVRVE